MGYRDETEELREDLMARDKLIWCIVRSLGGRFNIEHQWLEDNYPTEGGAQLEERQNENGDLVLMAKKAFEGNGK